MAEWLAGTAEWDITPPLGVAMSGYAGRPGAADHVLDPLFARALALSDGGPPLVLTGSDLLALPDRFIAEIRAAVADVVPPERLLLNHSHTHAGPTTARLRCMGAEDPQYMAMLVRVTAGAVRQAVRGMRPARLAYGTSDTAIGLNRRQQRLGRLAPGEAGTYDPRVHVLRVEGEGGEPLACWFSHGVHPVVMERDNTGLSAEWPGAAARTLRDVLGCPAIFAQGCCGDINPARRGGPVVMRSVGRELAGAALAAWERAEPVDGGPLHGVLERVRLPLSRPTVAEAQAALEDARARVRGVEAEASALRLSPQEAERRLEIPRQMLDWAEAFRAEAESAAPAFEEMDVQALRVGDLVLVALAAEAFTETGLALRRRSPSARTVALGYSNGCFGYLPTAHAYPDGGYEVEAAYKFYGTLMVAPESEAVAVEAGERLMRRIAP